MERSTTLARVASALALALSFTSGNVLAGTEPAGSMATARSSHVSVALPGGRALVAGGFLASSASATSSAEIFNATTATFSAAPAMSVARAYAAGGLLPDGRVLVAGGTPVNQSPPINLASAEIYDPVANTWSATGAMVTGRQSAVAVILADGRVLVIAGESTGAAAEVYDPATGSFTATGSLSVGRNRFAASLLADGRVLVAGGSNGTAPLVSAEVWDPVTGLWSITSMLGIPRMNATATALANGKVLIAGGLSTSSWSSTVTAAELYDPATGTFTVTGSLATPRQQPVAALLGTGDVVVAGGIASTSSVTGVIERYNVAAGTWAAGGSLAYPRYVGTAVTLANGEVLVAGGVGNSGTTATAELIDAACISIVTSVSPSGATYNQGAASGSIEVTQAPGCSWRVSQVPSWVTVTSPVPGSGSSTLTYTVAENTTTFGRGATLKIGDASFAINQSAHPCATASLASTSQSFIPAGGNSTNMLSASSTCAWTVTGAPAWITVHTPSGTGARNILYSVALNPGAARSATLSVATRTFTVSQAASLCGTGPTISPSSVNVAHFAVNATMTVTANAGCAWAVTGKPAWITMAPSGTGTTQLAYTIAANTGPERAATFTVAGKTFTVTQGTNLCAGAQLSPSNLSLPNTASSGTVTLTAPPTCSWWLPQAPWVSLTSGSGTSGTGNATFTYDAAANADTGAARTVNIAIAGTLLWVSQDAGSCAGATVSPATSASLAASGGTGSMTVTAPAACTWSVSGAPTWVTVTTPMPVTGSGTVSYTVDANIGTVRTASLVGAGATHVVSQLDNVANYCASRGASSYEWIQQVTLAGVTRTTGNNGGYADFTGTAAIPLAATNSIALTPGFSSGSFSENWRVWIDYNRDGVFSDSEIVAGLGSSGFIGTSFTIPAGVAPGNARMRISMKWGSYPSACETFTYGEVEDYTVVLP